MELPSHQPTGFLTSALLWPCWGEYVSSSAGAQLLAGVSIKLITVDAASVLLPREKWSIKLDFENTKAKKDKKKQTTQQ